MLTIYTAGSYNRLKDIDVDIKFPEYGKSHWEQVQWIEENFDKNISFCTFSPYIMNDLNALIAEGRLNIDDIEVWFLIEKDEDEDIPEKFDLKMYPVDENQNFIKERGVIDTSDFSDPISDIYQRYNFAKEKKS